MTLAIVPTLTITTASPLPAAQPGTAYSQTLNAYRRNIAIHVDARFGIAGRVVVVSRRADQRHADDGGCYEFHRPRYGQHFPNFNVTKAFTLSVIAPLTITTTSPLNTGVLGVAYSQTLEASGGTTPYSWSIASGSLPSPLALSSAGVITGTPTGVGSSNVTIRVRDSNNVEVTKAFTVDVVLALIISTASPLPSGVPNVAYTQTFNAAGGMAPYTWNVVAGSGNLPAGLTLSPGGQLSGTPTTAGTSNFTIRAFDSSSPPQNFQKSFSLSIIAALSVTTASPMPPATTGVAYSQNLAASGGTATFYVDRRSGIGNTTGGDVVVSRGSHQRHDRRLRALQISPSVPPTAVLQRRPRRKRCPSWLAPRSQSRQHRRCLRGCLAFLIRKL